MNKIPIAILLCTLIVSGCAGNWPNVVPIDERFQLLSSWGESVLRDRESGLVWQRVPTESRMNWAEAVDYCYNLTLGDEIATKRSGWRLPSIEELTSLTSGEARLIRAHSAARWEYFHLGQERRIRRGASSGPDRFCFLSDDLVRFWSISDDPMNNQNAYQLKIRPRSPSSFRDDRNCSLYNYNSDAPPVQTYANVRFDLDKQLKGNELARPWCVRGRGINPRPVLGGSE